MLIHPNIKDPQNQVIAYYTKEMKNRKNINSALVCCICGNPSQVIYDAEEEGLFLFCEFHMEEFRQFSLNKPESGNDHDQKPNPR